MRIVQAKHEEGNCGSPAKSWLPMPSSRTMKFPSRLVSDTGAPASEGSGRILAVPDELKQQNDGKHRAHHRSRMWLLCARGPSISASIVCGDLSEGPTPGDGATKNGHPDDDEACHKVEDSA